MASSRSRPPKKYDVFISYRREGGEQTALLISEFLKRKGYRTFFDIDTLRAVHFPKELLRVIDECNDFVLVLPPHALDRCENEKDYLRIEIERALQGNKRIIPILLNGFEFPAQLPESIHEIQYHNGLKPSSEYFDAYINKLCGFLHTKPRRSHRLWKWAAVAGLAALLGVLGWRLLSPSVPVPPGPAEGIQAMAGSEAAASPTLGPLDLYKKMLALENQDQAKASYRVAYAYYFGSQDVAPDQDTALRYALSSARQDNLDGMYMAAAIYYDQKDYEQAYDWGVKGAQQGSSEALCLLGALCQKGHPVAQDLDKAKQYYQLAADLGNTVAANNLIRLASSPQATGLLEAALPFLTSPQAVPAKIPAVDTQEQAKANHRVAYAYSNGLADMAPNLDLALAYALSCAEADYLPAIYPTAKLYYERKDYERAYYWCMKGAEKDDSSALCMLGALYHKGLYVEKDLDKAREYYQKSAALGNEVASGNLAKLDATAAHTVAATQTPLPPAASPLDLYEAMLEAENQDPARAKYRVAYAYYNGTQEVTPDQEIALEYALGSAVLGDARAMFLAGMVYYDRKDYESAYDWFAQSAEMGQANALCMLGNMYYRGHHVAKDPDRAKEYYQQATGLGDQTALSNLEKLDFTAPEK